MTDERERELLDDLLARWFDALVKPSAHELCPDDPRLAFKLQAMIEPYELLEAFRLDPATADEDAPENWPTVPGHELLALLGRGGMGRVFKAKQLSPERVVAVKLLPSGAGSVEMLRRFRQEIRIAGQLKHSGIVPIFEAGNARGPFGPVPFYSMEFVDGLRLDEFVRSFSPTLRDRVELLIEICDAVAAVHAMHWMHRDLKPSNILVTSDGRAKLLDFGVARAMESSDAGETMHTATGQFVGTRQYASPEQLRDGAKAIDLRSDVHALGLIAYEVLAGRRPYEIDQLSAEQAVHTICDDEPTALSRIDRHLRGDLETIVRKAMSKEPGRRYVDAAALRDDLRRYQRGERIFGRPDSTWYRLKVFSRRNKALAASVVVVMIALAVGMLVALRQKARADDLARQVRFQLADQLSQKGIEAADRGDPAAGLLYLAKALELQQDDPNRERFARIRLATTRAVVPRRRSGPAPSTWQDGGLAFDLRIELTPHPTERRTRVRVALPDRPPVEYEHRGRVWWAEISPDERFLASAGDHDVLIFDLHEGRQTAAFHDGKQDWWVASFSPDSKRLAVAGYQGRLVILEVSSGRTLSDAALGGLRCYAAAWNRSGTQLALGGESDRVGVFDCSSERWQLVPGQWPRLFCLCFTPHEDGLFVGTEQGEVACVNPETGEQTGVVLRHAHAVGRITCVGSDLVVALLQGSGYRAERSQAEAVAWEGVLRPALRELADVGMTDVNAVWLDAAGHSVFAAGPRQTRSFDPSDGHPLVTNDFVSGIEVVSDHGWPNTVLRSPDRRDSYRVVNLETGEFLSQEIQFPAEIAVCEVSSDRSKLLLGGRSAKEGVPPLAQLYDVAGARPIGRPIQVGGSYVNITFSPDSQWFALWDNSRGCWIGNSKTGAIVGPLRQSYTTCAAEFTSGSARLVTGIYDGTVTVWNTAGEKVRSFQVGPNLDHVTLSPDARLVITKTADGSARLWDINSGTPIGAVMRGGGWSSRFSPDRQIIGMFDGQRGYRFWSAVDGLALSPWIRAGTPGGAISFHPTLDRFYCLNHGKLFTLDFEPAKGTAAEIMRDAEGLSGMHLDDTNSPMKLP